jgi:hypothetical protein
MGGLRRRPARLLLLLAVAGGVAILSGRHGEEPPGDPPLLGLSAEEVVGVRIEEGSRELRAVRAAGGWRVEAPAISRPGASDAVPEMIAALVGLVAVDAFARDDLDRRALGLDPPRARVTLTRAGGAAPIVLLLGDFVPTGGSVYGALESDPRIFQIGAMVVSDLERVFYLASQPLQ